MSTGGGLDDVLDLNALKLPIASEKLSHEPWQVDRHIDGDGLEGLATLTTRRELVLIQPAILVAMSMGGKHQDEPLTPTSGINSSTVGALPSS